MNVKVKFTEGFKDGTIFPKAFDPGEVVVLTEAQLQQVRRSGGLVEVLENVIANPLKLEKMAKEKEPNDPMNPENAINDLESHVPGTDEEVAEVKERDRNKSKKK